MPKLKEFYEQHNDLRDKFEIVAFHESNSLQTMDELIEKMKPLEDEVWGGELPFPILIDDDGKTVARYGIRGFPTLVLIDPDGKVVKGGSLEMLKEKLGIED